MNKLKLVGLAIVVLILVIVVFQNTQTVETKLLFLSVTMPTAKKGTFYFSSESGCSRRGRLT